MAVKVFEVVPGEADEAHRPEGIVGLRGAHGGFEVVPEVGAIDHAELDGLSVFARTVRGEGKLFVLLVVRGRARPLLAESATIDHASFQQIRFGEGEAAELKTRRVAGFLCRRAGDVVVDQETLEYLQGGPPAVREHGSLELATALASTVALHLGEAEPIDDAVVEGDVYDPEAASAAAAAAAHEAQRQQQRPSWAASPPQSPAEAGTETYQDSEPVSLLRAITYPLRGTAGLAMIPLGIVLLLGLGCLGLLILPLFTALLFEVVRQTLAGGDTLRGLPELSAIGARLGEFFAYLAIGFVPSVVASAASSLLPAVFESESVALAVVAVPLVLAVNLVCFLLWNLALGALVTFGQWSLLFRYDLHFKALVRVVPAATDYLVRVGALLVFVLLTAMLIPVLDALPGMTPFAFALLVAIPVYLLFAGAYFIGLLFRENAEELSRVYAPVT
ncbi:MAG: hypothetical protein AAGC60_18175 [Acidobacteriota bacterium]